MKKKFARHIHHNYKLYSQLYAFAQDIHALVEAKKEEHFEPRLQHPFISLGSGLQLIVD